MSFTTPFDYHDHGIVLQTESCYLIYRPTGDPPPPHPLIARCIQHVLELTVVPSNYGFVLHRDNEFMFLMLGDGDPSQCYSLFPT